MRPLVTDLGIIRSEAEQKEKENLLFRGFLRNNDSETIDRLVHRLNDDISPKIDCTACGNCCRSLIIHTTEDAHVRLAKRMEMPLDAWKEKYVETSLGGDTVLNTIPCHFLSGNKCSVYEDRFHECREFPHLHRDHFVDRLFSTLMHYGSCPIIFNVVEELKAETGFLPNLPG